MPSWKAFKKAIRLNDEWRLTRSRGHSARIAIAKLSSRERAVFDLLCEGMANKVIAEKLKLSLRTVEAYRAAVLEKTDTSSIADLARLQLFAAESGSLP